MGFWVVGGSDALYLTSCSASPVSDDKVLYVMASFIQLASVPASDLWSFIDEQTSSGFSAKLRVTLDLAAKLIPGFFLEDTSSFESFDRLASWFSVCRPVVALISVFGFVT